MTIVTAHLTCRSGQAATSSPASAATRSRPARPPPVELCKVLTLEEALLAQHGVLPSEEEHIECVPVPKWHQPPDETTNGVDVGDMNGLPLELADDFLCTQTGPITGICVWASWYNDFLDPDASFILRLWDDNPTNQFVPFSTPSNLLCEYFYDPGQYGVEEWANIFPDREWFYDPQLGPGIPNADEIIWKYDFVFDTNFSPVWSPSSKAIFIG